MQDRYAGDVGDFGKIGMLRCIEQSGLTVGVNWYLVEDESHNLDGKHVGYLNDNKFADLDEELRKALDSLITNHNRSVQHIEELKLLQSDMYYHELLKPVLSSFRENRLNWHQNGLESLCDCDLVFLDPDNGLLPKSVSSGSGKSIKYVLPEEIIDYYNSGHSVVFYSHRTREPLVTYLHRFDELFNSVRMNGATILGISFRRGTVRDYFFILQNDHKEKVICGIDKLLQSGWKQHFEMIDMYADNDVDRLNEIEDCMRMKQFSTDESPVFYQAISGFPICNHTKCVSKDNLGYVQGVLKNGVPFEAELWKNATSLNMSVVLPEQFDVSDKKSKPLKKDNLMGFHNQVKDIHKGVLTIGMVDGGSVTELNMTMQYVDYLKENGLVEFIGDMENGSVFYVIDVEGKELAYITVTLLEQENVFAKTALHFIEFPNQPQKRKLSIVK